MKRKLDRTCLTCPARGKQYHDRALVNYLNSKGLDLSPWQSVYLCAKCAENLEAESGIPFAQIVRR